MVRSLAVVLCSSNARMHAPWLLPDTQGECHQQDVHVAGCCPHEPGEATKIKINIKIQYPPCLGGCSRRAVRSVDRHALELSRDHAAVYHAWAEVSASGAVVVAVTSGLVAAQQYARP